MIFQNKLFILVGNIDEAISKASNALILFITCFAYEKILNFYILYILFFKSLATLLKKLIV